MSGPIGGYVREVALHEPVVTTPSQRRSAAITCVEQVEDRDELAQVLEALGITRDDLEAA